MKITRRKFLISAANSCLIYAIKFVPGAGQQNLVRETISFDDISVCIAKDFDFDYREWIVFDIMGNVTIFTNRMELGQGLKTVLTAVVTQALDIPSEKLTLIMGDTD